MRLADAVLRGERIQQAPKRPPALFADSHFCAFALYPKNEAPSGDVEIRAETSAGEVTLRVPLPRSPVKREKPLLHQMAARALIRDIEEGNALELAGAVDEAVQLSLGFSVLCKNTAFVAIDERTCNVRSLERSQKSPECGTRCPAGGLPTSKGNCMSAASARGMRPPTAVTNAVSWRSEDIRHAKNELFLDVTERVHCLIGMDGTVLQSNVQGIVRMRSFLSGMPEIKIGLNAKSHWGLYDDLNFHQCVRPCGPNAHQISLIPPDGECEVMKYGLSLTKLPILVDVVVAPSSDPARQQYDIRVKSAFKQQHLPVRGMHFEIPLPADACAPHFAVSRGEVQFDSKRKILKWQVESLPAQQEISCASSFSVSSRNSLEPFPQEFKNMKVSYEIPGVLASGLHFLFLKVIEKSGYQAMSDVKYRTVGDACEYRLQP